MQIRFAVGLVALALSSCATLSENECRTGDWGGIGYEDGAAGRLRSYFQNHVEACDDYAVTPNQPQWLAGREQGLLVYCTPETAYLEGRRGNALSPVCRASELNQLTRANLWGQSYHDIAEEIDEVEDDMRGIQLRLASEFDGDLTPEQVEERDRLQRKLLRLRRELRRLKLDLRRYETLPY